MKENFNTGLINLKNISPCDFVAGDFSPLVWKSRTTEEKGFWINHIPVYEVQNNFNIDKKDCTAMATDNAIETDVKEQTGEEVNISDRFVAVIAGNTESGNYVHYPIEAIMKKGFVFESEYPEEYKNSPATYKEFIQAIPQNILDKALKTLDKYLFNREFVINNDSENLYQRLHESPLKATVRYASSEDPEEILNPSGKHNHDIVIVSAKYGSYWVIYDSYERQRGKGTLKRYAWNYQFGSVMRIKVELKNNNNNMVFKQNYPYLLVEGPEQKFGFYLDGRMVAAELMIEWAVIRENVNSRLKRFQEAIPIKLEDWNSIKHVNLKGHEIG
jgi:superoxide dismutase